MDGTTRVLQVDDEPDFLEMSAALLERTAEDVDVVAAESGTEALERLGDGDVDCVVSDYDMPDMDGLELLRAVRVEYPNMPFILLTARGSETVASEAISAGVDDYLQKGGGDEQYKLLANRVRNLVRQARAETSYREIFENATVGLTVRDKDTGELVDANERYCELFGYSKAELMDLDFEELLADEGEYTYDRAMSLIRAAGEGEVKTVEWRHRTSDGDSLWVEVSLRRAEIEGEERVLSSVQNISERKAREQDLAETREYYETVAANLPDAAVTIYDPDLTYQFVDGGIFDRLELRADEMVGASIPEFHSETFLDDHREHFEAALDGESHVFEFEFQERTYRTHALPVTDDESVIAGMLVARDVTEVRERQRRLEQVASLLSHDLRNPLAVAGGAVDLALAEGETSALEDATVALDRMGEIIDDALEMTATVTEPDAVGAVDLVSVARGAWNTVETGDAELDVRGPGQVHADVSGLRRLLENLFDNAVDHGGAGRVSVEQIEDGFAVEDDGHGIPAENRDAVFEMGFTTHPEGTGLGLAIVRRVAEGHGWSLGVGEGESGGARFEVTGVETGD